MIKKFIGSIKHRSKFKGEIPTPDTRIPIAYLFGFPYGVGKYGNHHDATLALRHNDTVTKYMGVVVDSLPPISIKNFPFIYLHTWSGNPAIYALSKKLQFRKYSDGTGYKCVTAESCRYQRWINEDGVEWEKTNDSSSDKETAFIMSPIWVNYDVVCNDGVIFEYENPIPIYNGIVGEIDGIPVYE